MASLTEYNGLVHKSNLGNILAKSSNASYTYSGFNTVETKTTNKYNDKLVFGSSIKDSEFNYIQNNVIPSYSTEHKENILMNAFNGLSPIAIDHSKYVHDFIEVNKPIILDNGNIKTIFQDKYGNEYNTTYIYSSANNIKFGLAKISTNVFNNFTYTAVNEPHSIFKLNTKITPTTYYVYAFANEITNKTTYNRYFGEIEMLNGIPYGTQIPYYENLIKTDTVDANSVEISTYSMSCRNNKLEEIVLKEVEIPELKIYKDGKIEGNLYSDLWISSDYWISNNRLCYSGGIVSKGDDVVSKIKDSIENFTLDSPYSHIKTEREIDASTNKVTANTYAHILPINLFIPVKLYTEIISNTCIYNPYNVLQNESAYTISVSINSNDKTTEFRIYDLNSSTCIYDKTFTEFDSLVEGKVLINGVNFTELENSLDLSLAFSVSFVTQDSEYNFVEKYVEKVEEINENISNLSINVIAVFNGETYYKKIYLEKTNDNIYENNEILFSKDVVKINETFEKIADDYSYVKFIQEMSSTYNVKYVSNVEYSSSYSFINGISSVSTKRDVLYERNGISVTYVYYSPQVQSYVEYTGNILEFDNVNYGCDLNISTYSYAFLPVFERTKISNNEIDINYISEESSYIQNNYEDFVVTYGEKSLVLSNEYEYVFSGYSFVEPQKTFILNSVKVPVDNLAYTSINAIGGKPLNELNLRIEKYDISSYINDEFKDRLHYAYKNITPNQIDQIGLTDIANATFITSTYIENDKDNIITDDIIHFYFAKDDDINEKKYSDIDNSTIIGIESNLSFFENKEELLLKILLLTPVNKNENKILYIIYNNTLYCICLVDYNKDNEVIFYKNATSTYEYNINTELRNDSKIEFAHYDVSNKTHIYQNQNTNYAIAICDIGILLFDDSNAKSYDHVATDLIAETTSIVYNEAIIRDGYWKRDYDKAIKPLQTVSYSTIMNSIDISNAYVVPTVKNELLGFIHNNEVSYYDFEENYVEKYVYTYYDESNKQCMFDTSKYSILDLGNNIYYGLNKSNNSRIKLTQVRYPSGGLYIANIHLTPKKEVDLSKLLNNGTVNKYGKKVFSQEDTSGEYFYNGIGCEPLGYPFISISDVSYTFLKYSYNINYAYNVLEIAKTKFAYKNQYNGIGGYDITNHYFKVNDIENSINLRTSFDFAISNVEQRSGRTRAYLSESSNSYIIIKQDYDLFVEVGKHLYYDSVTFTSDSPDSYTYNGYLHIPFNANTFKPNNVEPPIKFLSSFSTYEYVIEVNTGNYPEIYTNGNKCPLSIKLTLPSADDYDNYENFVDLNYQEYSRVDIQQLYRRMTVESTKELKEYIVQEEDLVPQYAKIDTPFGLVNGKKVNVVDEVYIPEQYTTVVSINPLTYEYETKHIKSTDAYIAYTYEVEDIPFITATYLFDGGNGGIKIKGFDTLIDKISEISSNGSAFALPSADGKNIISYASGVNLKPIEKTFNTYLSKFASSLVYINQAIDHNTSIVSDSISKQYLENNSYIVNLYSSINNLTSTLAGSSSTNASNEINAQKKMVNSLVDSINNQTTTLTKSILVSTFGNTSYAYSGALNSILSSFALATPKNWRSIDKIGYQYSIEEESISYQSEGYKHTKVISKGQRPTAVKKVTKTFKYDSPSYVLFSYANAFDQSLSTSERIGLHLAKESRDFAYNGYVYHEDYYTYQNIADILADLHVSNRLPTKNEFIVDVSKRLFINSDFIFSYTSDNEYALRAIRRAQVLWSELQKAKIVESPKETSYELLEIPEETKYWWNDKEKFAYFAYAFNINPHKFSYLSKDDLISITAILNESVAENAKDKKSIEDLVNHPTKIDNLANALDIDKKDITETSITKIDNIVKGIKLPSTISSKLVFPTKEIGNNILEKSYISKRPQLEKILNRNIVKRKI